MFCRKDSTEIYIISLDYIKDPHENNDNFKQISNTPAKPKPESLWKHRKTLLYTLSATFGNVVLATAIAYPSPAIPSINSSVAPFHLNPLQTSSAVSILSLGSLVGLLLGGYAVSKFGRQLTMVFTALPASLGWLLILVAPNVTCLYMGRFMNGICCGFLQIAVPLYISEISAPGVRGFMESCGELGRILGFLFTYTLGIFLPWNWLATACSVLPLIMLLLTMKMPESPRWLLSNGRKLEALETLLMLRVDSRETVRELETIQENLTASGTSMELKDFKDATVYKPFFIIFGLLFLQQFIGYAVFHSYMGSIFKSTGAALDPNIQTVIVELSSTLVLIVAGFAIDKVGRRLMLVMSALVMMLSLSALATYFTLKYHNFSFNSSARTWFSTLSVIFYQCGAAVGYGSIPFYLSSELFPLKARGMAGGLSLCSVWIFSALTTFLFPILQQAFHDYVVYWIMAGFAVIAMIYAYVAVPETKGRSLEELEKHFEK